MTVQYIISPYDGRRGERYAVMKAQLANINTPKEFYEWTTSNSCTVLPRWDELNPAQQAEAIVLYNNFKRKHK